MNQILLESAAKERINVLGIRAHALDVPSAKAAVLAAIRRRIKGYMCFVSVHGVMEAQRSPDLMSIMNNALLVAPDGMPLVWVGHAQGCKSMERVAGPEFMLEVMRSEEFRGCAHFLCGGEPGMAQELKEKLCGSIPGLNICGFFTPPFSAMQREEERSLIEAVHRASPDIIWVGLGAPKQDLFMARYLPLLDTTLMMGVGAAFLMHTGRIRQSPHWVRNSGLQWAHRLAQEPLRLWRRYLLNNPAFIIKILAQFLRFGRKNTFERENGPTSTGVELKNLARPQ
jgi:N-acetylglucosaminyldiphosphoundecaprenol N-acetyl-beta-D-mannosaminyltransferase